MRKVSLLLVIALLLSVTGAALAQDDEGEDGAEPVPGGTLNVAWQAEWESLDPHVASTVASFQILNNVLETLVFLDDDMNVIPWLATDWSQSEDGLTWTFNLREGVMFSNGEEMTAEHVKFTFDRLLDPEIGSGNAFRVGPEGTEVNVVDDYTIEIVHPEPIGILPAQLAANKSTGIMHPDSVNEEGIVREPIGTGPFQISDVQGTTSITLTKHEDYWQEDLPYLDAVEITPIPDETAREVALTGGEVDWLQAVPPQNFESLQNNEDVVVETSPTLSYDYLGLNLNREPFSNRQVRRAMAMAVDREQVCEFAFFGLCNPIQGPTGPGSVWNYEYAPYERDLEQARQMLADAGYEDGFEMTFMVTSDFPETVRTAQVLQQQFAEIGIEADIETLEFSEWLDRQGAGEFDSFILSWVGLVDANDYYYLQHRTDQRFNFTGYSNEEFDELVDRGRAINDFEERRDIYEQANEILVDDAPYIYLYNKEFVQAWLPSVNGYDMRPDETINFWDVWLEGGGE